MMMVRFRTGASGTSKQKKRQKKEDDTLPLFSTLLKQRRFDEIYEIIQFSSHLPEWLGIGGNLTTASILHQVIRNNAPLHLIDLLMIKLTELFRGECPASLTNSQGQTALHIAVICGSDLSILRRLTAQSTVPASTMDVSRRFPLHWACAATPTSGSSAVVRYLLELYPEAMTVRDSTRQTPLDLAARNKANQRKAVTTSRIIQLELTTALWRLLPSCRSAAQNGREKYARMRFVV